MKVVLSLWSTFHAEVKNPAGPVLSLFAVNCGAAAWARIYLYHVHTLSHQVLARTLLPCTVFVMWRYKTMLQR